MLMWRQPPRLSAEQSEAFHHSPARSGGRVFLQCQIGETGLK
jgi:hypothetical protein